MRKFAFDVRSGLTRSLAAALLLSVAMSGNAEAGGDRDGNAAAWKKSQTTKQAQKKTQPAATAAVDDEAPKSISNLTNGQKVAKAVTETEIVAGRDERPMLSVSSAPAMQDALARYEAIVARGGWPAITNTRMKVGTENQHVVTLKRRLTAEGYYPAAYAEHPLFTDNVVQAIRQFQIDHGLASNGRLDKATVAELNIPAERRLAAVRANLPRLGEYTKDLGSRYVVVNIPALQLEAVNGTEVFSRHNIIVGKPDRPSPVVMTKFSDINFNPYWNAPVSIVEKDIIPEVRKKGTRVLKQMGIRMFDGFNGPEVDPDTVNWSTLQASRYFFRQDPGEENAMAAVKINFPSPFGVYMHDTPTRYLFTNASRYLSSGCVRVDKIPVLVNWILNGQDGWNLSRIDHMAQSQERLDVKLIDPPQIRWVYLTAWPAQNGRMNFRKDIYDLDGTGFVKGQPTPVGEYADDGQRFFLKQPVKAPPAAAAVPDGDDPNAPSLQKALTQVKPKAEAEPVVAKKSFGKPMGERKPLTRAATSRTKSKSALAVADEKPKAKAKTNFNKPLEAKKKPAATKAAKTVQPKAKPADAKKTAAKKPADVKAATAKKAPEKAKVAETRKAKPVPEAEKPVKKKKPVQTTAAVSGDMKAPAAQ